MEEPARQILSCVDAHSDPDNVSWSDSRFYTGYLGELETPWCRLFDGTLLDKSRISWKPSPLNDVVMDASDGMLEVQAATVPPPKTKSKLQERMVQDVAKLTWSVVEVVGKERRLVAGAWSRLAATLGPSGCAAGRVCQTFSSPS